jgi:hypothetical protein
MSDEPTPKHAAVAAAAAVAAERDGKAAAAAAAADAGIDYSRHINYNEDFHLFRASIFHDRPYWSKDNCEITIQEQERPQRTLWVKAHAQRVEHQLQLRLMVYAGHENGFMFHHHCDRFQGAYQLYFKGFDNVFDPLVPALCIGNEQAHRDGYNYMMNFLENEVPHMILHADKLYTREDAAEWLDPPHLAENRRNAGALCFQCDVPCGDFMALSRGHYGRENSQPCCLKCYMLMDTAEEETMSLDLYMPDRNMYVSDRYEDGRFLHGCEYKLIHAESVGGECCAHRVAAAAAAAAAAGLSEDRLYELPTFKYDDSTTCSICREDFKRGDELRQTDCGHTFHQVCLDPWFDDHTTCPLCRVDCS